MAEITNIKGIVAQARRRIGATTVATKANEVSSAGLGAGRWGSELIASDVQVLELVRQESLLGRMQGVRRRPPGTRAVAIGTGSGASWVGESSIIPVSALDLDITNPQLFKLSTIVVCSNEMLSQPSVEQVLTDDVVRAVASLTDYTLLDPNSDGSDGISPASLTANVTPTSGTNNAGKDIAKLAGSFSGDLTRSYLCTDPETAIALGTLVPNSDAGARGGSVAGIPVLASAGAPSGVLALIDPTRLVVSEAAVELSLSNQAFIEMQGVESPPNGVWTSMFNVDCTAIKAVYMCNWTAAPGAVSFISGASYIS